MVRVAPSGVEAIRAHAKAAWPEEACGFLLGRDGPGQARTVVRAVPAPNERGDQRTHHFLIGPERVLEAEREAARAGLDVVGFYHSHPSGVARPSAYDRDHAWPWYSYVVVGVTEAGPGEVTAWRLADDRSAFRPEPLDLEPA